MHLNLEIRSKKDASPSINTKAKDNENEIEFNKTASDYIILHKLCSLDPRKDMNFSLNSGPRQ